MKTKEELVALKEEVVTLNKKLAELTEDELKVVVGGLEPRAFGWQGSGFQTPLKEETKEGHIFESVGSTLRHGNGNYYIYPEFNGQKH